MPKSTTMSDSTAGEPGCLDDETLVTRVTEGDCEAFNAIVERYYGFVMVVVEQIVQNRDDALEICQDVFLRAYEQIGKLRQPKNLKGWLSKIARNLSLSVLRRRRHVWVDFCRGQGTTLHGRADALIKKVSLKKDLSIGNRYDICRDIGRNVIRLGLNDRQRGKRSGTVIIIELGGAFEKSRMQIENVAGISFAPGRAAQEQRHLTIGDSLLG